MTYTITSQLADNVKTLKDPSNTDESDYSIKEIEQAIDHLYDGGRITNHIAAMLEYFCISF